MRCLIVHDYLDNIGGGEKLMLALAQGIGADLATLDLNADLLDEMGYGNVNAFSIGSTVKTPPLKQISASMKHGLADYESDYDAFILSGNWAHYAAKKHHPNLWYCHTPVRAFYTDRQMMRKRMGPLKAIPYELWATFHSVFDKRSVKNVDEIVANSQNTRGRVKATYGRDASVIYPGIDTKRYRFRQTGDYWLSVNRIYPEKRVDLQAEAFRMMPDERLVVVGGTLAGDHSIAYERRLRRDAPQNVEYRGRVTEDELVELYASCKGFICTAADEDFGMTPVEAMASGKPVVATREGGYLESVVEGETGAFAAAKDEDLAEAVKKVSSDPQGYRSACERRAAEFDTKVFVKKMRAKLRQVCRI